MRYLVVCCVALTCVGCQTFDDSRLRNDVLAYHQHADSVVAGKTVDTTSATKTQGHLRPTSVDSIAKLIDGGPVILAFRDSTLRRRTLKGVIDEYHLQDSIIDLRNIRDEDLPYTLSIALRNVDGVYAQTEHPAYSKRDPALSILWATVALPTFAFLGGLLGGFAGHAMNIGQIEPPNWFAGASESMVAGFFLGCVGGIITLVALSF